jgi:hypothetical protein
MQDIIIQEILKYSPFPYEQGRKIIEVLFEVNSELPKEIAARRPSFLNFTNVLGWGGKVENAHVASLSALNSKHGCFTEAYELIKATFEKNTKEIESILLSSKPIPGFGNPIYKGMASDPRCSAIRNVLFQELPCVHHQIDDLIRTIRNYLNKDVDANLVFWNAACIYFLGLPKECSSLVFILATQIRYINEFIKPEITQPEE